LSVTRDVDSDDEREGQQQSDGTERPGDGTTYYRLGLGDGSVSSSIVPSRLAQRRMVMAGTSSRKTRSEGEERIEVGLAATKKPPG
jgi:hypothetical protein